MSDVELVEVGPGRYRVKRTPTIFARSELPRPYVITDTMEPTEQVDGRFYTSKRAFRAIGREFGLTEVGNEKPKPKPRASDSQEARRQRRRAIKTAMDKAGD